MYFVEWDAFNPSGVLRKIRAQYAEWVAVGADVIMVILSPKKKSDGVALIDLPGCTVVDYPAGGLGKLRKAMALSKVKEIVKKFGPDIIYYRQSSWTPGLMGVFECVPKLVIEVNSDDMAETSARGCFLGRYTRYSRQLILTRADGFVCISEELARRYRDNHVPIVTIGNGFDLREVEPREPAANARPKAIFVGSDGQVWHGVDKLIDLADRLPNFEFHVVGVRMTEARPNVIAHGVLDWAQLHTLYSQMDVGIGTLALHRNGMSEASPLKTREYLAHGLPVIGAYSDTDLNGCSFYLRLENSEGGVAASVASIEAFVAKWRGVPLDRHRVEALIGAVGKEKRRLEFFRVIVNGKKLAKEGAAVFRDGKDRPSKR